MPDSKTILVILGAVAIYFLFIRKPSAAPAQKYRPPPPPPATGPQYVTAAANALPAIGSFLGNLFRGSSGSSSSSDDLVGPSYSAGNSAFADDSSFDYSS
jgi:hypothetical protein